MHARGSIAIYSVAGLLAMSLVGTSAFAAEASRSTLGQTKAPQTKPL